MRFLFLCALMGFLSLTGCGPTKPKGGDDPKPNPKPPVAEPPAKDPAEKPPANTEKKPLPEVDPEPTTKTPLPADIEGLIEAFKTAETRDGAVAALKAKGAEVVPALVTALGQTTGDARHGVLLTLGSFGKEAAAALPALKKLMESTKEPATRDAAQFTIDAIEGN